MFYGAATLIMEKVMQGAAFQGGLHGSFRVFFANRMKIDGLGRAVRCWGVGCK